MSYEIKPSDPITLRDAMLTLVDASPDDLANHSGEEALRKNDAYVRDGTHIEPSVSEDSMNRKQKLQDLLTLQGGLFNNIATQTELGDTNDKLLRALHEFQAGQDPQNS
jgi:hypothetical protein